MKCPKEYKVSYLTTSEEVVVTSNGKNHIHNEDDSYENNGPNLVWNTAQTEIVMQGAKN